MSVRDAMAHIKDVLFRTRGPLLPDHIKKISEETVAANIRSSERLRDTLKDVISEHNKLRGIEVKNGQDNK